ncbi:hypothetical protein E5357_15660 [Hominisplanchenecus murintestinalis]|uniref:Uncharacterized protein n=1 Tax=Hominisplanchenecus murintestinalis TaxID=2941517 RepID=A0AC61QVU0_9FIRM|nr:hypothetical protein E5357_15660 [Hominisplanchenecus murintestinalis]
MYFQKHKLIYTTYPHIKTIRFCLDSDEAGVIAANELAKKYMEKGYEIKVVVPNNGYKDFNEMLLKHKNARLKDKSR